MRISFKKLTAQEQEDRGIESYLYIGTRTRIAMVGLLFLVLGLSLIIKNSDVITALLN